MTTRIKHTLATLSIWAVAATSIIVVPQAFASTNVEDEIATSADNSWHSVIFVMKDQEQADGVPASTDQEKADHVNRLANTAQATQQSILDTLQQEEKHGRARHIESHFVVNAVSATVTKEVALSLAQTPSIKKVITDQTIEAEPITEDSGATPSNLSTRSASKHVPWNLKQIGISEDLQAAYSGKGITVGIIDSGVDINHPALKVQWRGNTGDKATSWLDTVDGSPEPKDSTGHGTHVLGTVLGSDPNGTSLLGVAPHAQFIAARVFDADGETSDTRLLKAMEWMLAPVDSNGVKHPELAPRIVNNSWGTTSPNEILRDAIKQWRKAGILPVFSAGNVNDSTPNNAGSITQPASFPESFAVGALRSDDAVAKFSLRGPSKFTSSPKPDIAAPGVNIRSSYRNNKMTILSGTSMAAPHVTGVAALVLSANPTLALNELEDILKKSATTLTDTQYVESPNHAYGAGKVNAALAIDMASGASIGSISGNVYVRGEEANAPKVTHSPVRVFYEATTTDLTAHVTDDSGIKNVTLEITNASSDTRSMTMKLVEGTKLDGTYSFTVNPGTLTHSDVSYKICATDHSDKKSCTQAHTFLMEKAVHVGWKEDFEGGTDGFEISGETPMWTWGTPADSLKPLPSGEKIVGIGMEGKGYKGLVQSLLLTPPIALNAQDKAAFTFKHRYDLDNYAFADYDTAEVWIGEVAGTTGTVTWEEKPQLLFKHKNTQWEQARIDLSKYAGKTIRVMFGMRGAWKAEQASGGWFLDDIAVEAVQHTAPAKVDDELSIDKFAGGRTNISFLPLKDETVSAYRLYRAHDDGQFEQIQELTGVDIQKYSISFSDYATPQKGTYTYYVTALAGEAESEPSQLLQRTFTQGTEITSFDFEDDVQNWTFEQGDKKYPFEHGIPSIADKDNAGKAPNSKQLAGKNPDSPNVFGTVLNDYRKPKSTYTLLSPEIDLSNYEDVTMYWQQWFNTRGRQGQDEWSSYDDDIASIDVRHAGGEWKEIFKLDENKIDEKDSDGKTGLRIANAWHVDGVKIPREYLGSRTQVRFTLKTGSEISDFAGGWYIDDVMFADTSNATIPQPKLTSHAYLTVDNGEELPLPKVDSTTSVTRIHEAEVSKSWIPARNATVELVDRGAKTAVETGTGAYSLRSQVGKVTVLAQAPGYKPQTFVVDLASGRTVNQDFYLDEASEQEVMFTVKDRAGQPIADAVLKIYDENNLVPVATLRAHELSSLKLLPGTYSVRAEAPGYISVDLPFTVKDEQPNALAVELAPATRDADPEWKSYDSNTPQNAARLSMAAGKTAAVKFDASEGAYVTAVRFFVHKASAVQEFEWAVWDADTLDGLPGKMLAGPTRTRVEAGNDGAWVEITMPHPIAVKDSYYMSYTQLTDGQGAIALGIDSSTSGTDRSFKFINKAWGSPDEKGQFMINAQVTRLSATPPAPNEHPEDKPGDQPGDKPGQQPGDKPGQQPGDKPDNQPGDKPGEQPGNKPNEQLEDKSDDKPSAEAHSKVDKKVAKAGRKTTKLPSTGGNATLLGTLTFVTLLLGAAAVSARRKHE